MRASLAAVRLGRLGDLIMTAPALQWLADAGIEVRLVTERRWLPLAVCLPGIEFVAAEGLLSAEPDGKGLRAPDLVLDLHGVARARPAVSRLGAGGAPTVRVEKESLRRRVLLLPHLVRPLWARPRWTWPERHLRAASQALRILGIAPPPPRSPRPTLACPGEPRRSERPRLGLQVGASRAAKSVSLPWALELAQRWRERAGGPVLVLAGPGEEERVEALIRGGPCETLADTSLPTLLAGVARCDAVVGGDTGPVHLAGAFGRPVVQLFGPTPADAGFAVWGGGRRPTIGCAPCSLHGPPRCPKGHGRCMAEHDVEAVLDLLAEERGGCASSS